MVGVNTVNALTVFVFMMSLLRHSSSVVRRLLFSKPKRVAGISVIQQNYYGDAPSGYDYTHLEGPDQVQGLDSTVPLTPEKRAELAAKYDMRPEDYEPLNDSTITLGDYPKLPYENSLERDPHYDWDDPFLRRNFGEPIFHEAEAFTPVTGLDTRPLIYDRPQMWRVFLTFFFGFVALWTLGYNFKWFLPRAPKQFPEYYPGDEMKTVNKFDWLENRDTGNVKVKERKQVIHYTFPKVWDPKAH